LLIFSANEIYSFSCKMSSVRYGFEHSDLIFIGKVVVINIGKVYDSIPNSIEKETISLEKLLGLNLFLKLRK
jgi:hypothetical protein